MDANKKPLPRSRKYRRTAKASKHKKNYSINQKKFRAILLALILLADALVVDWLVR